MRPVVELESATKCYGHISALQNVTLALGSGESVGLIGHNGAGKTTLMKLVLGMIRPDSGSICVQGENPAGKKGVQVRQNIGFVPESVTFHGAMTGAELLSFYARLKHASCQDNEKLLERVGLAEAASRRVGTYSKGMRQRLALAQALIGRPGLLLLDEPTSGLDPESRSQVYGTIDQLRAEGASIMVATHALAEIERHIDRVALLYRGRLIAAGDLPTLRARMSLPTQVRVKIQRCTTERFVSSLPNRATVLYRGMDRLDLTVPQENKIGLLRDITAMGDIILDIEIEEPDLEALYHHLSAEAEQ